MKPSDVDDVKYIIVVLASEIADDDLSGFACLAMLRSWLARTLMQNVIDKRNAAQKTKAMSTEVQTCD